LGHAGLIRALPLTRTADTPAQTALRSSNLRAVWDLKLLCQAAAGCEELQIQTPGVLLSAAAGVLEAGMKATTDRAI
jgi:hypothetical protein